MKCTRERDTGFPKTDYFALLEPKKEVSSDPKRKRNLTYFYDFKEPGEYKVVAIYKNAYGEEIGLDTFRGEIESKPVKIRIAE